MSPIVVTGIGMVTPLGVTAEDSWRNLLHGVSGAGPITAFSVEDMPCKIACQVPRADTQKGKGFDFDAWVKPRERRRMDTFIVFAIAAAHQALQDSGLQISTEEQRRRVGVAIGSGVGGLPSIERSVVDLYEGGARRVSPFFIPGAIVNLASGNVSIRLGLKGPNMTPVTACATGTSAIGDAARAIKYGDADVMLAGGAESAICRLGMAGFSSCRALSTNFNATPEKASRPYDKDRDGFVMGEGAGVVVLESYDHAMARGAHIYGEVAGYGMSGDAYHITAPDKEGRGAYHCMKNALSDAGVRLPDVQYVNAHGTSTPLGDEIEIDAVTRLWGGKPHGLFMSSTKSATGHLLGAAGAVEAIFSLLAMRDNIVPPTLNLDNPSMETTIDLVPHKAKKTPVNVVLSNSFGFGGTNASLVLKSVD